MIYGRFGDTVEIVAVGTLDDVRNLDGRKPDQQDREAVENGSYVVVQGADGKRRLYHQAFLRADGGAREIGHAIERLRSKPLRIVVAEPGKPAEVREIEHTLEAMQALVGGYLECVTIWSGHDMWVADDSAGMEPNRVVASPHPGSVWPIQGTLFVADHTEDGDTVSLNPDAAAMLVTELNGDRFCRTWKGSNT